jgi:hypothetical protein
MRPHQSQSARRRVIYPLATVETSVSFQSFNGDICHVVGHRIEGLTNGNENPPIHIIPNHFKDIVVALGIPTLL